MCCFKDEEKEVANEGGEPVKSDKKIFKKEIKSKNSHKRHAKESLVPAFKVADNEAWSQLFQGKSNESAKKFAELYFFWLIDKNYTLVQTLLNYFIWSNFLL